MLADLHLPKTEAAGDSAWSKGFASENARKLQKGKGDTSICSWDRWEFILELRCHSPNSLQGRPADCNGSVQGQEEIRKPKICLQEPRLGFCAAELVKSNN